MTSASRITTTGSIFTAISAGVARGVTGTVNVVVMAPRYLKSVWISWRNRGPVLRMLEMDDHMLRDIGLTRGDVSAALSSPLDTDPSTRLRIIAVERRAGQRAQARLQHAWFRGLEKPVDVDATAPGFARTPGPGSPILPQQG